MIHIHTFCFIILMGTVSMRLTSFFALVVLGVEGEKGV